MDDSSNFFLYNRALVGYLGCFVYRMGDRYQMYINLLPVRMSHSKINRSWLDDYGNDNTTRSRKALKPSSVSRQEGFARRYTSGLTEE
jgi:hypothetical protein